MPIALLTDIADAVAATLAAANLPGAPAIQRSYRPQFSLEELKTLRISVVPKALAIESVSRSSNQHDVAVDVGVQKKLTSTPDGEQAELDGLLDLVEQIAGLFKLQVLGAVPATWVKTENQPVYAVEHLEQQRVFTSVLTLTFRVVR